MPLKSLFGAFGASTADVIDTFLNVIIKPNMELDELAKIYSEKLDSNIRDEQNKGLRYVGGTFKISYANERYFNLSYELYFQDKNDEWIKKDAKSKPQKTDYLTDKSLAELRTKKEIAYEIDEPEQPKNMPSPKTAEPEIRKIPKNPKETKEQ